MRILHFYKTAYPDSIGGVEQVIHQLASGMTKQNITIDVLALTTNKCTSSLHVENYIVHRSYQIAQIASTGVSLSVFSKFVALAKQADIVHYHFPWPFMDLVHFITQMHKPSVVTYHADIVRQKKLLKFYQPLMSRFLSSVDMIVATSPNYLTTSPVLQNFVEKTTVIPLGLDQQLYPSPTITKLNYWRQRIGPKFFLFVGVLRYYKGLHILLAALKNLNYPIVIVGDGSLKLQLQEQAVKLGLGNIHFLGYVDNIDKIALITLCYSVIFPSHLRAEAFGMSLLEGAMFGKPLLSCEIGTGTSFINIHDLTGLVVPPQDSEALAQAMQFLWSHEEIATFMGEQAKLRYQQLFTADKMLASYADLYRQLLV